MSAVESPTRRRLRDALDELCAERPDKGAGLTFKEVLERSGVSRATANRPAKGDNFKKEFDGVIAKLAANGDAEEDEADTRTAYRRTIALLAMQVQALEMELARERDLRGRSKQVQGTVIPFPAQPRT